MNLVIDDAVEVRLATKTEEEKRRPLGMIPFAMDILCPDGMNANDWVNRPNPPQG